VLARRSAIVPRWCCDLSFFSLCFWLSDGLSGKDLADSIILFRTIVIRIIKVKQNTRTPLQVGVYCMV
jgi:hypothetical protein